MSPPERLKIDAPRICFHSQVKASATGIVDDWEVGILQSISQASWAAQYTNAGELRYRVNTDEGPVRDGGPEDSRFFRKGHPLKSNLLVEFPFTNCDQPGVTFLTELPDDLLHPLAPTGNPLPELIRTEGKCNFHSFLAVANKVTETILTLAESHWTLSWDGTYDFASKTWMPVDPDSIITHSELDCSRGYEKPRDAAVSLPFSLRSSVANERKEIWFRDRWMPCKEGLPDREVLTHPRGGG